MNILNANDPERVGYPTQKPVKLLQRILKASSNPGDVVFDPFCGCGTTIHAAQGLGRAWVGIDICVNACKVIERRLVESFDVVWSDVEFIGMPKTPEDAAELAELDKFKFERWAVSLVDGMEANKRQRGDQGIDGKGRFPIRKGQFIDLVSQAKGGSTGTVRCAGVQRRPPAGKAYGCGDNINAWETSNSRNVYLLAYREGSTDIIFEDEDGNELNRYTIEIEARPSAPERDPETSFNIELVFVSNSSYTEHQKDLFRQEVERWEFPREASFRIEMSRAWSATSLFNRWFSRSSSFRRRA